MPKSKLLFILGFFLTVILSAKPSLVQALNFTEVFSIIDRASIEVKIKKNLEAEIDITLPSAPTNLPALSWPLPQGAYDLQAFNPEGNIKFNLVRHKNKTLVLLPNKPNISLSYKLRLVAQKNKQGWWEIFLPLIREPRIGVQTLNISVTLPQEALIQRSRLYLVHGGSITEEHDKEKNFYSARVVLEPFSILSWEAQVEYNFQSSLSQKIITHLQSSVLLYVCFSLLIVGVALLIFWRKYFHPQSRTSAYIPSSFLANSYLYYKRLTPHAIAATILQWAAKGFVTFVEKEESKIIIGKNTNNPTLSTPEQILWDFLFGNSNKVQFSKIKNKAEQEIVPQELLSLKQATLEELQQKGYLRRAKIGFLDTKTSVLILALLALISLSVAAWISNVSWLVLPAIVLNLALILIGEYIPQLIFLTSAGKGARKTLEEFKKKLRGDEWNLLIKQLPWFVFFGEEEEAVRLCQATAPRPLPFLVGLKSLELPHQKIEKIIQISLEVGQLITSVSRL